jgi:hypothetical protein
MKREMKFKLKSIVREANIMQKIPLFGKIITKVINDCIQPSVADNNK